MVNAMGGYAVRPLLRRPGDQISIPPTLAAVAVAVGDRRRQEASLQAEEVAEAGAVRSAVPDQVVGGVAAVQAAVEVEAGAEAEAEFSRGLTLTPELPHQLARDLTKSLLVSLPLFSGVLLARLDHYFRQSSLSRESRSFLI
jgi:hypothetical protein